MGLCTINGIPIPRLRVLMQLSGCWVADVVASDPVALAQQVAGFGPYPVTIAIDGGLTFRGSPTRAGEWLESGYLRVIPGAGGMGTAARPRSYRNVSASVIVKDLLAAAGETLSSTSSPKVLATQFPFYSVNAAPVGRCLDALLMDPRLVALGTSWRSLADGTVFVGTEGWPDAGLIAPGDYQDLAEAPQNGVAELGFDSPILVPGVSLEGRRISAVEHNVDGERCRSTVWFQDTGTVADRIKGALYATIRSAMARFAFAAPRFARVVAASTSAGGATVLDVAPEDATFATLQRVPLFHGAPGEKVTLAKGTRVLVEFSGGDPAKPFVRGWAGGESVSRRTISADLVMVGGDNGDFPAQATPLSSYLALVATHVHPILGVQPGSGAATSSPAPSIADVPSIAATNVKVQ